MSVAPSNPRIGVSLPLDKLPLAQHLPTPIELKLNWEDYPVLSGDRSLQSVCSHHDINADDVVTIHLPPGTTTRGREIGMAATRENVGTVKAFVATQLDPWLPTVPLVLHPAKQVNLDQYLPVLQQYHAVTRHPIRIETPSAERATLHTVNGVRQFCQRVADRDVTGVKLVIDTAHIAEEQNGWEATETVLGACGDIIAELHLNDPVTDGLPHDWDAPALKTVMALAQRYSMLVVLEPDTYDVGSLRRATQTLQNS